MESSVYLFYYFPQESLTKLHRCRPRNHQHIPVLRLMPGSPARIIYCRLRNHWRKLCRCRPRNHQRKLSRCWFRNRQWQIESFLVLPSPLTMRKVYVTTSPYIYPNLAEYRISLINSIYHTLSSNTKAKSLHVRLSKVSPKSSLLKSAPSVATMIYFYVLNCIIAMHQHK